MQWPTLADEDNVNILILKLWQFEIGSAAVSVVKLMMDVWYVSTF